jgi:hypothetical protein
LPLLLLPQVSDSSMIGAVDLSKYKPGQELDICLQLVSAENTKTPPLPQQQQHQLGSDMQLVTTGSSSSSSSSSSADATVAAAADSQLPADDSSAAADSQGSAVSLPAGHADSSSEQVVYNAEDDTQNDATSGDSASSPSGAFVWRFYLENLRFVLVTDSAHAATAAALETGVPAGMPGDTTALSSTAAEPARYEAFKPTANMLDLERRMRAATIQVGTSIEAEGKWGEQASPQSSSNSRSAAAEQQQQQQAWWKLQQKYGWHDGQVVFKSLYAHCPVKPGECAESCG